MFQVLLGSSKILAIAVCCLVLAQDSEARPSAEAIFVMASAGIELSAALQVGQPPSAAFVLSDWAGDSGSGGFAEYYSDGHRHMDEWETIPDE